MTGSLAGLRVVDFTRALAGPFCSRLLVDAGANVVKVEPLGHGDFTRGLPPKLPSGRSLYFHQQNYGKRSIAVDLRVPPGRNAVLDLIRHADMVIENYRPGVMARLGLDFDSLVAVNPDLVMLSISGFGQQSSLAALPGQDLAAQARSGLLDIHKTPAGEPLVPNTSLTDIVTGAYGFAAAVGALSHARSSGRALWVELSILGAALQLIRSQLGGDDQSQPPMGHTDSRTVREVADDPQSRLSGAIRAVEGEHEAEFTVSPIATFSDASFTHRAEDLGESTYWALTAIAGLSDDEILALMSAGAIEVTSDSLPSDFPHSSRGRQRSTARWTLPPSFRPPAVAERTLVGSIAREIIAACAGADLGSSDSVNASERSLRRLDLRELQAQAASGLMDIYGQEDGPPQPIPTPAVTTVAGALLAGAAMLPTHSPEPEPTLDLEHVALIMHDTALQEALASKSRTYFGRGGGDRRSLVPYGVYPVADGYLALGATGGGYRLLMEAVGHPPDDPRFALLENRLKHRDEFRQLLCDWGQRFSSVDQAETLLAELGVVCARVRSLDEALNDQGLIADGWVKVTPSGPAIPLPFRTLASRQKTPF